MAFTPGPGRTPSQLAEWAEALHLEQEGVGDIDWSKDHRLWVALTPQMALPDTARPLPWVLKTLTQMSRRGDARTAATCRRAIARLFGLLAGGLVAMARDRYTWTCQDPVVLNFSPERLFYPPALYLPVAHGPCDAPVHAHHPGIVLWHEWAHNSDELAAVRETYRLQIGEDPALWFDAAISHQRARQLKPREPETSPFAWRGMPEETGPTLEKDVQVPGTPIAVPYEDREIARQLGLKWAAPQRSWYAPAQMSASQLAHIRQVLANRQQLKMPAAPGAPVQASRQGRMFIDDFRRRLVQLWEDISAQSAPDDPHLEARVIGAIQGLKAGLELLNHPGARDPQVMLEVNRILDEVISNAGKRR